MRAPTICLTVGKPSGLHTTGLVAEAEEAQIQKDLPHIAGLTPDLCQEERMAIYTKTVAEQYAAFVSMHGDPFGKERRSESRGPAAAFGDLNATGANHELQSDIQ